MPTNSKEYQKEYQRKYREKMSQTRKVVSVSVPNDDFAEIERYAKMQGMSVSALMREATLYQSRHAQMQSKAVEQDIKALHFLISNIANNVNQMAYHSNRMKQVADENAVFQELKKLDDLVSEFIHKRTQER